MNALAICALLASIFYVLFFNWELLKIYIIVFSIYSIISLIYYPFGSKFNTSRKKVGIVTWSEPYGPEIFCCLRVRFSKALALIADACKATGKHVTPTHLVTKALAEVLKQFPELNAKLAFGCIVPYKTIDVTCLVSLDEGHDLGLVCFRGADNKSLLDITTEASKRVDSVRTGEERKQHKKATGPLALIPTCIGGVFVEIVSWLIISLGLDFSFAGLEKHPGGAAVITNIGMLGAELVYAPFPTFLRVPVIIVMHTIRDEIVVDNGQLGIEKMITIAVTIDHRFIDGVRAIKAQSLLKTILEDPESYIKL